MTDTKQDYARDVVDFWNRFIVPEAEDRAALAAKRRGLGEPPGSIIDMYRYVPSYVLNWSGPRKDAVFIAGALFGLHWKALTTDRKEPFTAALKRTERSESYEKRVLALLKADREELPTHLRHAVAYIKSKGDRNGSPIPIDWAELIRNIANWEHQDRFVQQNWANAWWGNRYDRQEPITEPVADLSASNSSTE